MSVGKSAAAKKGWETRRAKGLQLSATAWSRDYGRLVIEGADPAAWIDGRYSSWPIYAFDQTLPKRKPTAARRKASRQAAARKAAATRKANKERAAAMARREAESRQALLAAINGRDIYAMALEALHSCNRLAKHDRETAATIYARKDRYLQALLRCGHGKLYMYEIDQERGGEWYCNVCDRSWYGRDRDECYSCGCDADYLPKVERRRWYLVEIDRWRFHAPGENFDGVLTPRILEGAEKIPPHNPTQEPREVPNVVVAGRTLTVADQLRLIEIATERLEQPVPT